ncbi:unnamed protein product [Urochloa humidicola]
MVSPSKMAGAEERPRPRPPRPYKIFCKFQDRIEHVWVHEFDISNGYYGLKGYLGTLSAMKDRQIRLSPFLINKIPVTPLINPVTGHSSYFIIRLLDSNNPRYKVDLLFRDTDLYFVGFRRELVEEGEEVVVEEEEEVVEEEDEEGTEAIIIEEGNEGGGSKGEKKKNKKKNKKKKEEEEKEEEKKEEENKTTKEIEREAAKLELKKNQNKPGWGRWHCFSDSELKLPEFFGAKSCGLTGSYGGGKKIGGCSTFTYILLTLACFDEAIISANDLEGACYCVMVMFSEASHLRSVLTEMLQRIVENQAPRELVGELDKRLNNWTQLGRVALKARLDGKMEPGSLLQGRISTKLPPVREGEEALTTLKNIIDEHKGEILLIKSDGVHLGFSSAEIEAIGAEIRNKGRGLGYEIDVMF